MLTILTNQVNANHYQYPNPVLLLELRFSFKVTVKMEHLTATNYFSVEPRRRTPHPIFS